MKTSTSTYSKKSGKILAFSSSSNLPQSTQGGRSSRTSKKALKPLSPEKLKFSAEEISKSADFVETNLERFSETKGTTPTHPVQFEPDYSLPIFPYPTISQLHDFPNVETQTQQSVIVTLPHSAPASPTQPRPIESFSNNSSPIVSPGGVSVILSNPGFRPLPQFSTPTVSTPVGVGSWDNFLEVPTYQRESQSFWATREHRVQIVSTDISELEDPLSSCCSDESVGFLNQGTIHLSSPLGATAPSEIGSVLKDIMSDMEKSIKSLKEKQTAVEDMCDDLDPNLITSNSASAMEREIEKIEVGRNNYRNAVRQFLQDFDGVLTDPEKEQWKSVMKSTVNKVNTHKMTVLDKVNQLTPKVVPMSEFEKETIDIQKQQLLLQQKAADTRKEESLAVAKPLMKLIVERCGQLQDELDQVSVSQLQDGDDQQITRVILKISGWKQQMNSITMLNQDLVTKTALFPLSANEQSELTATVERVKASLADITTTAEDEDLSRQLYSLDTGTRIEQIKWPTFNGDPGEDYFKFKKDFLHAAKQNRTSARNQVSKLRENVKGYAKSLLPATVDTVEKGFSILEHAFGDSMRVVNHRLENLMKVGIWPAEGSKDCYAKQVLWIVKVQGLLQEIIDLAESEEELAAVVYNREKLSHVLKLFPTFMVDKLAKVAGYKKEKYDTIIVKLDEWKTISQNRETIFGSANPQKQQPQPKPAQPSILTGHTGHAHFPKPKRLATCRICKVLESQGVTDGLFENHVSDFATGCPKFAAMGIDQRMVISREAKFCVNCMAKDIKFSFQHNRECSVKKKKGLYSCKKSSCLLHMWLCSKHLSDNREQLEKFDRQLQAKAGISLTFISTKTVPNNGLHLEIPIDIGPDSPSNKSLPGSPLAHCNLSEKGIKQAVRKLHRLNKKKDPDVVTVSPPAGVPLFLFQPIEGINGPVNVFYDKGCSDACFRSGVPGTELRGTLLNKGPFDMGGVGNITTKAEEEWIVQMNRVDGKKQLVRGVTLKQLTCDFPAIDTTKAVEEIKASDPENIFLQSCKVPKISGGKIDVLLGIQYSIIQPVPIQELDSGLTIYKARLTSYDSSENALIGGPHTSFQFLSEKCGNTAALLAHFTEGLQSLRLLGPPRIPINPLSLEDEIFALSHNSTELGDIFTDVSKPCVSCFTGLVLDDDYGETLKEIKKLRLEQECGMELNYRCVKCRDCQACKDSDKTESLSLKEEAEMEVIDRSVSLDLENRRIHCTLPLRGDEKLFLSNNYHKAKKILEQQVKQYSNQPETKELIIKAFEKLFSNGHAAFLQDLDPEDLAKFSNKEIRYFIPWRIAFSDSVSTPARPVLDASSRTSVRPDGTGGKSLNDLVCQGKVENLNLLNLVLNFRVGKFAMCGDLQQFYNSCKLDPSQWNLQHFLYQPDMNPEAPIIQGVIKTLIYGVASVSAQSENAMKKLGKLASKDCPEVSKLIEKKRYVDDIGDSKVSIEDCINLSIQADKTFDMVDLKCKCWTFSGRDPDPKVSKDGASIAVAGSPWYPLLDVFVVRVPPLHFGKRRRGRLDKSTKFFTGTTLEEMDAFCPTNLNRKQVTSKFASIWDVTGKLGPVLAEAKQLLSLTVSSTADWTSPMPSELRSKWLSQFLLWEKIRGLRFERAVMPEDAVDGRMRLIQLVDASNKIVNQGCWGGFKKKSGGWSCQQILSRSLLAPKNSTIPKLELQSLANGSNMCWLIRKMLDEWVDEYILCSDSIIALCWVSSEKKSLSLFHRNRVVQVRRGSDLSYLYHIRTEENLADLGTRPEKVRISDIGPDSDWELGRPWMRNDINSVISQGVLRPISDLRMNPEAETDFKDGFILGGDSHDFLCNVVNESRVEKLKTRSEFSNYLLLPTRYSFPKLVRILGIVISFVTKCRKRPIESLKLSDNQSYKFSAFSVSQVNDLETQNTYSCKTFAATQTKKSDMPYIGPTDEFISQALTYLYRKATCEVIQFNSKSKVEKIGVLKDGILFSKGRIVDGMSFAQLGDLKLSGLDNLGLKAYTPVIDRYSPLAYCIGSYVHWCLGKHKGVETCNRICLENVTIMQGANLFKELSEECIRCKVKRKKFVDMPMGLVSEHQLNISPPFWIAQMDFFGPFQVYVPGFEKTTRNRQTLKSECNVLIFACPVTRLINLQVVEKKDSSGVVDGVTRLSCEIGVPKLLLIDQDATFIKAMSEVEFTYQDAEFQLHRDLGIEFVTCPVSGHNQHGQVERRIRTVKESLREAGVAKQKLTATGLQTMLKLIENQINNFPLGYCYGNDQDNTALLKMISPNMLRTGRNNSRALNGPMRLPKGGELLDRVQEVYESWYKVWSQSYIPKLMFKPKWWKAETDLKEEDVVLFQKKDSVLEHEWTMGRIDQLVVGRDGLARRAIVRYQNATEDFKRTSDRSVRSLVKIFSLDDCSVEEDLEILHKHLLANVAYQKLLGELVSGQGMKKMDVVSTWSQEDGRNVPCCQAHQVVGLFPGIQCSRVLEDLWMRSPFVVGSCFLSSHSFEEDVNGEEDDAPSLDCDCSLSSLIYNLELNLH